MDYPVKTISQIKPLLVGFRKAAGLTQQQMATRLGVTQQTYARWEAKPVSGSIDRIFKVLRLLNVDLILAHTTAPLVKEQDAEATYHVTPPHPARKAPPTKAGTTQSRTTTQPPSPIKKREDW